MTWRWCFSKRMRKARLFRSDWMRPRCSKSWSFLNWWRHLLLRIIQMSLLRQDYSVCSHLASLKAHTLIHWLNYWPRVFSSTRLLINLRSILPEFLRPLMARMIQKSLHYWRVSVPRYVKTSSEEICQTCWINSSLGKLVKRPTILYSLALKFHLKTRNEPLSNRPRLKISSLIINLPFYLELFV